MGFSGLLMMCLKSTVCILDSRNGWELESRSISLLITIAGSPC